MKLNIIYRRIAILAIIIVTINTMLNAQLQYKDSHIFLGQKPINSDGNDPGIYIGPEFVIEYWNNGINVWKTFGSANWGNYKMFLDINGNVGIGKKPAYKLDVNGRIYSTGTLITSDERLKRNIVNISDNRSDYMSRLMKLNGKSYEKQIETVETNSEKAEQMLKSGKISDEQAISLRSGEDAKPEFKQEFGFVAQEMKEIFPELVEEGEDGMLAINYNGMIPVLLEGIKDLQAKVEELEAKVRSQESGDTKTGNESVLKEEYLSQNVPNPFNGSTTIRYTLPQGATKAEIKIYSTSGALAKTVALNTGTNSGSITLSSSELSTGLYVYSLVVNGAVIDSKKMVNK